MSTSGAPSRRITLRGYPGDPKPRILGEFFLTADNVTLSRLLFDGPTGRVERRTHDNPGGEAEQLYLSGRNLEVTRSEVRNNRWHAGIYALNATDARIVGNYIHHNGDFADPARVNLDHGIYFASGSGLIADNLITRNYAFGVHLYPSPRNVVVRNNRIFRQGRAGVIIGSEPGEPLPAGNRIVGKRNRLQRPQGHHELRRARPRQHRREQPRLRQRHGGGHQGTYGASCPRGPVAASARVPKPRSLITGAQAVAIAAAAASRRTGPQT